MNADKQLRSSIAEIDYSRDTLFGPIPMQATCRIRLTTIRLDGHELRELTILGEVPDYLGKSGVIRVAWEGHIEAGPIRDHYSVEERDGPAFKLVFENEYSRALH